MEVIKIYTDNNIINLRDIKNNPELIDIMALCNNAVFDNKDFFGDSIEVALANYLLKYKINFEDIQKKKKINNRITI